VLEKAMSAPEDYAGLIVRVSGFSDFFVSLNEKVQRDILARNVHH
jgi:formate C-acetyltransferase